MHITTRSVFLNIPGYFSSNSVLVERNRHLIERSNSILFGHRTKSDNNFFVSSISEPNRTKLKLSV